MRRYILLLFILFSISSNSQSFGYSESKLMKIVLESSQPIQKKQEYAVRKYKEYSSKMGRKTVRSLQNKIYVDRNLGKAFYLKLKYILTKVKYNGKQFRNVRIDTEMFFKNMNRAYSQGNKIVIVPNSKGRMVKAVFENGYEDVAKNTHNMTITIDDEDTRDATLALIKYLIDYPYYKGG